MTLQLLLRELKGFLTPQLQLNILHLMGMGNPTTTKLTIPICYLSHLLSGTKPKNQGMNYGGSKQVPYVKKSIQKLLWYTFYNACAGFRVSFSSLPPVAASSVMNYAPPDMHSQYSRSSFRGSSSVNQVESSIYGTLPRTTRQSSSCHGVTYATLPSRRAR